MASDFLSVTGLGKTYRGGPSEVTVLSGLDLDVSQGECVAIVGASGVGKSTLLHLLGALDHPTEGEIMFRGESVFRRTEGELARFRNRSIGFVFQFHYLLPEFTALENVTLSLRIRGDRQINVEEESRNLLSEIGLTHRMGHRPSELSGGEQQRVAIARALLGKPDLILADEPTGNLDQETARSVTELLVRLVRKEGKSLIVATHNMELASVAHRVLRLKDGKLVEERV